MIALVTYPYRDRETLTVHYVGEEVELTDERFAELSVDDPAEEEGGEDAEPGQPAPEQPVHEKPSPEMTVQQLRDAIEAADGFAPRKATKAELIAILETL